MVVPLDPDTPATPPPNGGRTANSGGRTAENGAPPHLSLPDLALPDQKPSRRSADDGNSLKSTKKVPKPDRFEGLARESITAWAERRGFQGRILHEGQLAWEAWGPAKNFLRPLSSWVGSFKGLINSKLADGSIERENDDERAKRETREFRECAEQPDLATVGDTDV